MARPCVICSHPDRAEIDTLILNGKNPGITGRYDVSSSASSRHRLNHVQPSVVAAAQARGDLSAESIITNLSELSTRAEKLLAAAGAAGDRAAAAKLIKECRETLTTLGRTVGLFAPATTILLSDPSSISVGTRTLDGPAFGRKRHQERF